LPQSQVLAAQNLKHFSASTYHLSDPSAHDTFGASVVRSPWLIALGGQLSAHLRQRSQNSATPNSMGRSHSIGRLVKIFASRSRGPYLGVIRIPLRPSSPKPAWIANGTLSAVSLPVGIAL
jgi:hypothetical protein